MEHINWMCIKAVLLVEKVQEVSIFWHDGIVFLDRSEFYNRWQILKGMTGIYFPCEFGKY